MKTNDPVLLGFGWAEHASHISGYFEPAPANRCAILERGTG